MAEETKLSNYPYVRVRIRCERCRREGDLSLARLAERYGADAALWDVMLALTANCSRRRLRDGGRLYAPCYAQLIDLVNGTPPDLPPGYHSLHVIEGEKSETEFPGEERPARSSPDAQPRARPPKRA